MNQRIKVANQAAIKAVADFQHLEAELRNLIDYQEKRCLERVEDLDEQLEKAHETMWSVVETALELKTEGLGECWSLEFEGDELFLISASSPEAFETPDGEVAPGAEEVALDEAVNGAIEELANAIQTYGIDAVQRKIWVEIQRVSSGVAVSPERPASADDGILH